MKIQCFLSVRILTEVLHERKKQTQAKEEKSHVPDSGRSSSEVTNRVTEGMAEDVKGGSR